MKKLLLWGKGMNVKIDTLDKKWELAFITTISLLVVFGVTFGMGTITSGFHLVDDHEFLEWLYQMKAQGVGVFSIIGDKLIADLSWRYEPLYYFTRIFSCYLFGGNLTVLSVLKASEIVVSMIFLYYCGQLMGGRKLYSLLFAVVSLVGYQSAVWWKLGPQEAQCTVSFAIGLYCVLKYLNTNNKKWMIASLLFLFIMVNYKESYIILMPFIMLYILYYELRDEDRLTWRKVGEGIQKRKGYLICLGIIFLVPVFIIVTYVGTHDYGEVGLDASVPLSVYVEAMASSLKGDLKWYKYFGILFGLILLTYWENLKKMWRKIFLVIVFLLPQIILFGRAGLSERYILPSAIGFAFFFVLLIPQSHFLSGKRKMVYVLGILLLLAAHGRVMLREADYFRYRGNSVTAMLEAVNEMAGQDTNVLACFRPNEEGNLTINYWMKLRDFDRVYYWTEETKVINKECDRNLRYDEEAYTEQDFEDMDIVVMYNKEDRHYAYDMSLDLSGFTEIPCGTLTIYVRDSSGIPIVKPEVEGLRINF